MQSEKLHKQEKIPDLNRTLVENSSENKIKQVCLRGVIYARYSSGGNQTEQSIEGQLRDCEKYAKENNIEIVERYLDSHISGKEAEKRLAFQRMIADSDKHLFDVVIVWKTDRFARNRYDSARYKERLKRNGVTIRYAAESIPDTAEGIILESMLEGMAEYYSADLKQKILRGMKESAYKCKVLTTLPIGYLRGCNGEYVVDESTAPYIQQIFEMYVKGEKMKTIADTVNRLGLRTVRNNPLNAHSIAKIVQNEHYIGVYEYKNGGIRKENAIPAIIDKELFDAAQERKTAQKRGAYVRKNMAGHAKRVYPLSGLAFCGECGATMFAETTIRHSGTDNKAEHGYYTCSSHRKPRDGHKCPHRAIPRDILEDVVKKAIVDVLFNQGLRTSIYTAVIKADSQRDVESRLKALQYQKKQKEKTVENILSAVENGFYSESVLERLKRTESEIRELKKEIRQCQLMDKDDIGKELEWLITKYEPPQEQQDEYWHDVIHCFIKSVTCFENGTVIIRFNLYDSPTPEGPVVGLEVLQNINGYMKSEISSRIRMQRLSLHQSECLFGNGFHQNDFRTNSFFADYQLYYHEHSLIVRTIIP